MRRSSGRGQETPYRHFRVRGPEVVAVSSHGPTEVGRQQRGQADRPHEQLCQGLRVPLLGWEHRDLRVRTRAWEYVLQQNIFPDEAMARVKSNNFQLSKLISFQLLTFSNQVSQSLIVYMRWRGSPKNYRVSTARASST